LQLSIINRLIMEGNQWYKFNQGHVLHVLTYGIAMLPGPGRMRRGALPGSLLQMWLRQALPAIVVLRRATLAIIGPHLLRGHFPDLLGKSLLTLLALNPYICKFQFYTFPCHKQTLFQFI